MSRFFTARLSQSAGSSGWLGKEEPIINTEDWLEVQTVLKWKGRINIHVVFFSLLIGIANLQFLAIVFVWAWPFISNVTCR